LLEEATLEQGNENEFFLVTSTKKLKLKFKTLQDKSFWMMKMNSALELGNKSSS